VLSYKWKRIFRAFPTLSLSAFVFLEKLNIQMHLESISFHHVFFSLWQETLFLFLSFTLTAK